MTSTTRFSIAVAAFAAIVVKLPLFVWAGVALAAVALLTLTPRQPLITTRPTEPSRRSRTVRGGDDAFEVFDTSAGAP